MQGSKEQAQKAKHYSILTSRKPIIAKVSGVFSTPTNKAVAAVNNSNTSADHSRLKVVQAEESFRTVMYLSCWGPN